METDEQKLPHAPKVKGDLSEKNNNLWRTLNQIDAHDLRDEQHRETFNRAISFRRELQATSEKLQAKRERLEAETEVLLTANGKLDTENDELKNKIKEGCCGIEILIADLLNMGVSADILSSHTLVLNRCRNTSAAYR